MHYLRTHAGQGMADRQGTPHPRVFFIFGDCSFTLSIGREGYLKSIPVDGAHLLVEVLPEHPEQLESVAPGGSFSRDVSAGDQ